MSAWNEIEEQVRAAVDKCKLNHCGEPFFRGHGSDLWFLSPGLGRGIAPPEKITLIENRLYYRFLTLGSHLLPENRTSWDTLYWMQHHSVPTRLLDWSQSFAVALFFALHDRKDDSRDAAVFVLNTYALNNRSRQGGLVYLNTAFPRDYAAYFVDSQSGVRGEFPASALAVIGPAHSTRMRSQRGVFTLHGNLDQPLDELCGDAITKVRIPRATFDEARQYLRLAGVDEFSLFPDLDGLSALLREEIRTW